MHRLFHLFRFLFLGYLVVSCLQFPHFGFGLIDEVLGPSLWPKSIQFSNIYLGTYNIHIHPQVPGQRPLIESAQPGIIISLQPHICLHLGHSLAHLLTSLQTGAKMFILQNYLLSKCYCIVCI